ncbi:MAG: 7-cyano-7-deazaguanine synthase QueC [Vicinamibacteria bacterium]|nr:7-cyano-7-deazaguanine synthase QueC [Vicinamibacteria bacterium]
MSAAVSLPLERELAVVCVSGGMDSAVTAAIAADRNRLAFLHASYGQRTASKERDCFHRLADHMRVERRLEITIPALALIGGSSLTDESVPIRHGAPEPGVVPATYVPFRNANILAAAVSWAEAIAAHAVFYGAVWADSSGYPDCRPEFYRAFESAVRAGTRPEARIGVVTPVIHMRKAEIVRRGMELGVPFEWTWSCYESWREACGECESCLLRRRGFAEAGVVDPIHYRAPVKP